MPMELAPIAIEDGRHSPHVARKRQARLRRILATALAILRSEGRPALTLKALGEQLDLTPAAIYRYFPSKDALIAELQRVVIASLAAAASERVACAEGLARSARLGPRDRALLAIVVSALVFESFARDASTEFGLLSSDLGRLEYALPAREAAQVFEMAWRALGELAGRIEAAAKVGALVEGPGSERAIALWAALQGVAQTRKLVRSAAGRIDPPRIARGVVGALLVGWGAVPARVERVMGFARERELAGSVPSALAWLEGPEP